VKRGDTDPRTQRLENNEKLVGIVVQRKGKNCRRGGVLFSKHKC